MTISKISTLSILQVQQTLNTSHFIDDSTQFQSSVKSLNSLQSSVRTIVQKEKSEKPIWVGAKVRYKGLKPEHLAQVAIARGVNGVYEVITGKHVSLNTRDKTTAIKNARLLLNINYFNTRGNEVALAPSFARPPKSPPPKVSNLKTLPKVTDIPSEEASIIVNSTQPVVVGLGGYGLPGTPFSSVDSIRLTANLNGIASIAEALKTGKNSDDIKLSFYLELTMPQIGSIPKGKADFIVTGSITAQLINKKLVVHKISGLAGLLVAQDVWKGFGPLSFGGYSGFGGRIDIDWQNKTSKPIDWGLTAIAGQTDSFRHDFEKEHDGQKIVTASTKLNGYFYDIDAIGLQSGVFNPVVSRAGQAITKRVLNKKTAKNLGVGLNVARLVDNLKNALDSQKHYSNGRIQKVSYIANGYVTAGAPFIPSAPGLVAGITIGLNSSLTLASTGKQQLEIDLPGNNKKIIDIKGVSTILKPVFDGIAALSNTYTSHIFFKEHVRIACVFQAQRDANALKKAAQQQPADVKKVWIDHAGIIENNARLELETLRKAFPEYFDNKTKKLNATAMHNALMLYQWNKKLIEQETRPLIPVTSILSRDEYKVILESRS